MKTTKEKVELDDAMVDVYFQLIDVQGALQKPYDMPMRATKASQSKNMLELMNRLFPYDNPKYAWHRRAFKDLLVATKTGIFRHFEYETPVNENTLDKLIDSFKKFPIVYDMIIYAYEDMDIEDYYEEWYC